MKKLLAVLFVALTLVTGAAYAAAADKQSALTEQQATQLLQQGKPVYTCPMHTHVYSEDKNGKCPICGMNLTEIKNMENK